MADGMVLDIQRASLHDGPGIRTAVFLKGCPLHCQWCHNPESQDCGPVLSLNTDRCTRCGRCVVVCENCVHEIMETGHEVDRSRCVACGRCVAYCPSQAIEIKGRQMSVEQVMNEVAADIPYYQSGGGMTLTGGEPLLQFDFALALAQAARERGIHVVIETSGFAPQDRLATIAPWVDLFLFDYKATDPLTHERLTGVKNELILHNLDYLCRTGARVLLRCPLVSGVNDDDAHLQAIAGLSRRYPSLAGIEIMPYHPMGNEKARRIGMQVAMDLPRAEPATVDQWLNAIETHGCPPAMLVR